MYPPCHLNSTGTGTTCIHVDRAGITLLILKQRRAESDSRADEASLLRCSGTVVHWRDEFVTWQPDSPEACLYGLVLESMFRRFSPQYLHIFEYIHLL